jgi:putative inorganic carbon (HCO3(-)) transporter
MAIGHFAPKSNPFNRLSAFFQKALVQQRMNSWLGYVILWGIAVFLGYLMAEQTVLGLGVAGLLVAITVAVICISNAEAGLYICIAYSFYISYFSRLLFNDELQVGIFSDLLILVTFLGYFIRKVNLKQSFNQFTQTPVVIALLLLYAYTAIELFNPNAHSFAGWFPAFRKSLGTVLLLFISYNVFDSLATIKRFIKVLFIMITVVGIYGCIQEWHGFFPFEMEWLRSDPKRFRMTFYGGNARKISTMPDALSFSIIMAAGGVFFTSLMIAQKKLSNKIILLAGLVFIILGLGYSMTRTAYAMLIVGIALFVILTLNRVGTRIIAVFGLMFFLLLLYGPYQNSQIEQFRSTFEGKKDDSYNVRETNRKMIQPYIYHHPMGGGLSTTGDAGITYNPGHELAGFPPDSGYLKKALEMGWIGFAIILTLYYLVLRTGIRGYFTCRNEETKVIYAGCTASCFCFYVGDFSQVAIGQITDIVVYFPFIAIILKLKHFDQPPKLPAS